ncbi:MAG: hypothetical protein V1747_04635 [Candidatus Omnitrophota bacterium]
MGEPQSFNIIPIVFFILLSFAAWKICKKTGLNPYLSILVFFMAILNQGLGLLAFIVISIFAAYKAKKK